MSASILYRPSDIRTAIKTLFADPGVRRVAITAFVGDGAEAYLPKPSGLHLICWPKAGGTNPTAIRELMKRGVHVQFSDSLHMKVYWAKDRGAVITSANLSTNALGSGNLKEIGIRLPGGAINIDRVIESVSPHEVSKAELRGLDRKHKAYYKNNRAQLPRERPSLFLDWYNTKFRPLWKVMCWNASEEISEAGKAITKTEFGRLPQGSLCGRVASDYMEDDFVLCFRITKSEPKEVDWFYADRVIRVPKSDKYSDASFPFEAIQVGPAKWYPAPPFKIDVPFRRALSKTVAEYGVKETESMVKPTAGFVEAIQRNYK